MAKLSDWILEDINVEDAVLNEKISSGLIVANDYTEHSQYVVYSEYSEYDVYFAYNVYGDYGDYSDYSNSITIITQPTSQTIESKNSVTFTVTVSESSPTYQWYVSDSAAASGTAISGATSNSYTFNTSISDNGKYYYCIIKRGGRKVTSNSALLTVIAFDSIDIATTISASKSIYKWVFPSTSAINSCTVSDTSIATVTNDGIITGVKSGTTTCIVNCSNSLSKTIVIHVFDNTEVGKLEAIFKNDAIAIRKYKNSESLLTPNKLYNMLESGSAISKSYTDMDSLFTDLHKSIKNKVATDSFKPELAYEKILSLIQLS